MHRTARVKTYAFRVIAVRRSVIELISRRRCLLRPTTREGNCESGGRKQVLGYTHVDHKVSQHPGKTGQNGLVIPTLHGTRLTTTDAKIIFSPLTIRYQETPPQAEEETYASKHAGRTYCIFVRNGMRDAQCIWRKYSRPYNRIRD
jgi:hypothetical protein